MILFCIFTLKNSDEATFIFYALKISLARGIFIFCVVFGDEGGYLGL